MPTRRFPLWLPMAIATPIALIAAYACSMFVISTGLSAMFPGGISVAPHIRSAHDLITNHRPELDRIAGFFEAFPTLRRIDAESRTATINGRSIGSPRIPITYNSLSRFRPDDLQLPPTPLIRFIAEQELIHAADFLEANHAFFAQDYGGFQILWRATGLSISGSSIFIERRPINGPQPPGKELHSLDPDEWTKESTDIPCRWYRVDDAWIITIEWT